MGLLYISLSVFHLLRSFNHFCYCFKKNPYWLRKILLQHLHQNLLTNTTYLSLDDHKQFWQTVYPVRLGNIFFLPIFLVSQDTKKITKKLLSSILYHYTHSAI